MLFLYSDTINVFLKRLNERVKTILIEEVKLTVRKSRFEYLGRLYPISIVVFDHPTKLGFFENEYYRIGINKLALYSFSDKTLDNLLRHELAHYLAYIFYGPQDKAHGPQFIETCKRFGWMSEVSLAKQNMDPNILFQKMAPIQLKVFEKIKKLLSLASSSNEYEAQLATSKANELLVRYNLDKLASAPQVHGPETCVIEKRLGKRLRPVDEAIYSILKEFLVEPVYSYGKGSVRIEIIGERVNVELASYVADFLSHKLEDIWLEHKKINPNLSKSNGKKWFMQGLAQGFKDKIQQSHHQSSLENSLILIKKDLARHLSRVHPRLTGRHSFVSSQNLEAKDLGRKAGKNLNIHQAIHNNSSNQIKLLN